MPEGYVRGLEKLWGLAIREVDEVEDTLLTALVGDEEVKESSLGNWNDEGKQAYLRLICELPTNVYFADKTPTSQLFQRWTS